MDLTELRQGETGTVVEIRGGHGLRRRLESLGIRVGSTITKISTQLMRGPITIRIGNTQVAIGFSMAKRIEVGEKQ